MRKKAEKPTCNGSSYRKTQILKGKNHIQRAFLIIDLQAFQISTFKNFCKTVGQAQSRCDKDIKEGLNDCRKKEQKRGNDKGLWCNHWKEEDKREKGQSGSGKLKTQS